ncbi:MAG: SCP2 sterol-binding domain-containing protein [Pseudomonadota bacterium]|nr:SCP2 sterol-binding domain-containing protein [Pseudomonadota bacterium]
MLNKELSFIGYVNKVLASNIFVKSIPENYFTDIDNKKIKINLKDIEYSIIIKIKDNTLLLIDEEDDYDVELIATPITLILFILSKGSDKFSSKIIINGDIETANKFNKFLSSSEKIKEIVIHLLGEDRASQLEDKSEKLMTFFKDSFKKSSKDVIDLLTDDLNFITSKTDINQYLDDVDDLKSRTDKLYQKYKDV